MHPARADAPPITPPRPGPRLGALRVVSIEPLSVPRLAAAPHATAVQGVLPIDDLLQVEPPARPASPRRPQAGRELSDAEVTRVAQQFCVGVVEVLFGDRPASQLLRCTSERVYTELTKQAAMAQGRQRMTGVRVTRARLERVRIQRPSSKAVEVCARLRQGKRFRALALRLELVRGRWVCVALEAG